ncbi:serine/threonine protein kinase, partial [Myxococcota bacterium]|nr:serine/threonine protein kinase [Myxococcota bacterium]
MDPRPPGDPATSRLGPYRLLHCIAQGGMGEVHLATLEREAGFRKRVAIKRALPQLAGDPRVAERFEREARLSAVLAHRHIVQVFDFGRSDGAAWLAMEYVHGVDLKAVQDRLGAQPLPAGVALEIGLACAAGLHHAHGARDAAGVPMRLVHRDVSPHNVLLSFDGDVKLTDFGLADAATGPDGPDGLIQGKYAYMSPEQARGGAVDARADQYALGVVLYELLSGARAFQSFEGPLATLDRVASGRPLRPLAELGVAPALALVVGRAMAVDPEARYPDMQHFAGALRAAGAAAGVTTGEPPLSDWLRAVFPERLTAYAEVDRPATPPVATEVTAAALEPIGTGGGGGGVMAALERTLDAVSPAALDHTV